MNGTRPHPLSLRRRMRLITTGTCTVMALLGLWSFLSERPLHGVLALVAALTLLPGSIWGRKARRRPASNR